MFESAETKSVSTPFGAVVGQGVLKEALLAVAVDDGLDGLLVSGEKGTAKSTLVRGLAALLPDQRAVANCPYGCPPDDRSRQCERCRELAVYPVETRPVPLVTLPLGATRERVVGTLSVADALGGDAEFDPGLLARANRGLLYVDEVNLLDDHLVDVLLDAAASGRNRVERDGVSVTHPAEFTLVGTMNPEEGDLRPQLRDRFALSVEVAGLRDPGDRVAVIDGALDDAGEDDTETHRRRLRTGRELLPDVGLTDDQKYEIAELCLEAGVDGHRADVATARAARTLAALDGRPTVTEGDLRRAASLALGHRMRSTPFEEARDADDVVDEHFEDEATGNGADEEASDDGSDREVDGDNADGGDSNREESSANADNGTADDGDRPEVPPETTDDPADRDRSPDSRDDQRTEGTEEDGPSGNDERDDNRSPAEASAEGSRGETDDADETAAPIVPGQERELGKAPAAAPDIETPEAAGEGSGGASAGPAADNRGGRVRTEPTDGGGGLDAAASVRAAATRGGDAVERRDLRRSVRTGDGEALVVFAVDASASMRPAIRYARGVTLELLEDAYTERDSVAVVAFAGTDAEVLLPPTDSVALAARHLKSVPTGDRTPLPAGLRTAADVVDRADPAAAVVVVVSDGRANASTDPTAETRRAAAALGATDAAVVCVEAGEERGLLETVAEATDGDVVPLDDLTPGRVERAVSTARR